MVTNSTSHVTLELYIPGLLAAPPRLAGSLDLPDAPALRAWVQRSESRQIAAGRFGPLLHWLGTQGSPPLAALTALDVELPGEWLLLAEPVHLKAGMHDLVLFAGPALQVEKSERETLGNALAEFFRDAPCMTSREGHWLATLPHLASLSTTPLHDAQGRPVRDLLPKGEDAARVHAWMNEMQMFLHDHAVNRARAARGLLPLNGVWFHGEGALPHVATNRDTTVFATSAVLRGLGKRLGASRRPGSLQEMVAQPGRKILEVRDCIDALDADDVSAWQRAVQRIDAEILAPLLQHAESNELVLFAGDGFGRRIEPGEKPWRRFARKLRRDQPLRVVEE